MTQAELAVEASVGSKTVARIELGDSARTTTARKVADALDVAVTDLMESPPVPAAGKASAPQAGQADTTKAPDVPMPEPSGHAHQVQIAEDRGGTHVEYSKRSYFEIIRDLKKQGVIPEELSEEDAWRRFREEAG